MQKVRQWLNYHIGMTFLLMVLAVSTSGWAIYRYIRQREWSSAAILCRHCGAVLSAYSCGACGKMDKTGSKLFQVGQITLAMDAIRNYLRKETQGQAQLEIRETKVEETGKVLVTALVNGKKRRFRVDLSVSQGEVTELPPNKGDSLEGKGK